MKNIIKAAALATLLLCPAVSADAQVSFGITIGQPPAPRAYRVPPRPGPEYLWVEGYQYPQGGHYKWHDGYWTRPPYSGAYWVQPYYIRGQYYAGRWEDGRRSLGHDHHWDASKNRDWNHGHDENHGR